MVKNCSQCKKMAIIIENKILYCALCWLKKFAPDIKLKDDK